MYLSDATRLTGRAYDLYRAHTPLDGTVHSICRRILADRRFSHGRMRPGNLGLVDELDQYFIVLEHWDDLLDAGGFERKGNETLSMYLTGRPSKSRHGAVAAAISLFNRFSEECLDADRAYRATGRPCS